MIEIEIDYNNDELNIRTERGSLVAMFELERSHYTMEMMTRIFNEIENLSGVKLTVIDEDSRRTIDEW